MVSSTGTVLPAGRSRVAAFSPPRRLATRLVPLLVQQRGGREVRHAGPAHRAREHLGDDQVAVPAPARPVPPASWCGRLGPRPQLGDHPVGVVGGVDGGAGDEDVGAGLRAALDRLQRDAAVDLEPGLPRASRSAGGRSGSWAGTGRGTSARRSPAPRSSPAPCRARPAAPRRARSGVAGLSAIAARAPLARISRASRTGARAASTWKVTEPQPASTYSIALLSGSSIIRCASRGTSVRVLSASTIVGPKVRLGTKWLSITSTCTQSALPIRATSSPSRAKSALRMLGVIWMPTGAA